MQNLIPLVNKLQDVFSNVGSLTQTSSVKNYRVLFLFFFFVFFFFCYIIQLINSSIYFCELGRITAACCYWQSKLRQKVIFSYSALYFFAALSWKILWAEIFFPAVLRALRHFI